MNTSDWFIVAFLISCILLAGYRFLLRSQLRIIERKIKEYKTVEAHNQDIIKKNQYLMNKIEIGVFQSKEHVLWMYNHYKDMLMLISNVSVDDIEILNRAASATKMGMDSVGESFAHTFGMTPEQYVQQKTRMTYTNQQGLSYPAPNAGVN